jgi:hypothetical protein
MAKDHEATFRGVGYTPLLMHSSAAMQTGGAKVKRIPSPEEEAKAGLYLKDGKLYVPFVAIRNCTVKGARNLKIGKQSAGTFLAGTILNVDLDAPCFLQNPKTGKALTEKDYVIDTRRAVVQGQGVLRSRAKIMEWAFMVSFSLDTSAVSKPEELDDLLLTCLNRGGQFVGICDYRPEKGGPFGRFRAEKI